MNRPTVHAAAKNVLTRRFEQIRQVLAAPSINHPPHGDEYQAQQLIAQWIKDLGVQPHLFTPTEIAGLTEHRFFNHDPREYRRRPNVAARWTGRGEGRSLLLTTHVDVVGIGDQSQWPFPPFAATVADGHLHGRGTVDVKAGLTALLVAIETVIHELDADLSGDVIFASVVDEEFGGMNGSLAVVEAGYKADGCLLVEPSQLNVCPSAPGGQQYFITVKGKAAYEGDAQNGVCAIGKFLKVYQAMRKLEVQRNVRGRQLPMYANYPMPFPITISTVKGGDMEAGGIADQCRSFIWHASMPGESLEQLIGEVESVFDQLGQDDSWLKSHRPTIELLGSYLDPCQTSPNHPFVQAATAAASQVLDHCVKPTGLRAACDMSRFVLAAQIPTVVIGPGDPAVAHTYQEKLSLEQLQAFIEIIATLILNWCQSRSKETKYKAKQVSS